MLNIRNKRPMRPSLLTANSYTIPADTSLVENSCVVDAHVCCTVGGGGDEVFGGSRGVVDVAGLG
jgi:hypothetical protein